jgi:DNA-binding transcriptional LysR family regulator
MELRHLRYFAAVAAELHFARAAERLNITPPTLSQQIKWLEQHLGVTLFVRNTKKKVELTFAGKQFQKHALALIENFDKAEHFVREAARGEVGEVRLGYVVSAMTSGNVKAAIEAARKVAPNVRVHIQRMETLPQIKTITSGNLDIGFLRRMQTLPAGLVSLGLPAERMRLFLHRDHPLAAQKRVSPAAMAKHKFVAYELDAEIGFWRNISAVLQPATIPQIAQRAPDATSLLTLISADVGISVLPDSFKHIMPAEVVMRDIAGPAKYSQNAAVYRANEDSPAVRSIIAAVRDALGST